MATVDIGGAGLYCEEQGSGSPILLIHGAGGDADIWGETRRVLAAAHRVIAYDRRGFRRSVHSPVTDYHRHGEDAAALLAALDATPATVVGWSGGGLTALDLVVNHPELVCSLVLVEPPLHAKRHPDARMLRTFAKVQLQRHLSGERRAVATFFRWASSYTTGGSAFERMPPALQEAMLATAAATLGDLDGGTGEHLTMEQIAAISCPVTCLLGDLTASPIANATQRIVTRLPTARLVMVPGAGHAVHYDQPQQFAAAVLEAAR